MCNEGSLPTSFISSIWCGALYNRLCQDEQISKTPAVTWHYVGWLLYLLAHLQGDLVAILDNAGNKVVEYKYDAWGKPIGCSGIMADTLGRINPFRYRGYIYDNETSMYSLCYRYYNPAHNRFINADDRICISNKLTFTNAYSYCCGTPVNTKDSSGTDAIWLLSGAGCTHVSLLIQDENGTWYYYFWGANHPNWGGSVFYAGSSALVGSGGSSVSSGGSSASSGGSSVSSGSVVGSVGVGFDVAATGGYLIYVECPFDFSPTTRKEEILSATSCTYAADGKPVANEHTYYKGVYTHAYYISGDFTASHNLISAGGWPIGSYDLLENNCVQTSIDLLMASKDANPQWGALLKQLDGLRTLVHPGLITELADLPDILPK